MLSDLRKSVPEGCLSELELDELQAGELQLTRVERAEEHLRTCARCTERQRALLAAAGDFLERYPEPPSVALTPRTSRLSGRVYAGLTASLALAAGIALFVRAQHAPLAPDSSVERSKGGARLGFYVKRGDRVFQGADGERVRAGDQLRFVVTNAAQRQIAILSRDGSGQTSVYYPSQARSFALGPARQSALDAAVQLDATPGSETLFGIFCSSEFELEPIRAALDKTGHLPTLVGCTVDELRVIKEVP